MHDIQVRRREFRTRNMPACPLRDDVLPCLCGVPLERKLLPLRTELTHERSLQVLVPHHAIGSPPYRVVPYCDGFLPPAVPRAPYLDPDERQGALAQPLPSSVTEPNSTHNETSPAKASVRSTCSLSVGAAGYTSAKVVAD